MHIRTSLLVLTLLVTTGMAMAEKQETPTDLNALKHGAQLYDNWPKLTGQNMSDSHPLYPEAGKKQGAASWRCKECHGWDYVGKDGRYAKGSHYTGIKGVFDRRGAGVDSLSAALKSGQHDFSGMMSESDIAALALFLDQGQTDITEVIDSEGRALGDSERGKPLYQANCSDCHGDDGNALDFKGKKEGVQGVGWLANENPQESWHKILWGHPGSDMPSMVVDAKLTLQQSSDLLAYSQSLP